MTIQIDIERRTLQLTTHLAVIATLTSSRPNLHQQFLALLNPGMKPPDPPSP